MGSLLLFGRKKGFGGKFECHGSQVCFLLLMRSGASGFQATRMCVVRFSLTKKQTCIKNHFKFYDKTGTRHIGLIETTSVFPNYNSLKILQQNHKKVAAK
jgi:hypothetical protein